MNIKTMKKLQKIAKERNIQLKTIQDLINFAKKEIL